MKRSQSLSILTLLSGLLCASQALGAETNCSPIAESGLVVRDTGLLTNATIQSILWNHEACPVKSTWYYFASNSSGAKFRVRFDIQALSQNKKAQRIRVTQFTPISSQKELKEGYQEWIVFEGKEEEAAKKGIVGITIDSIKAAPQLRIIQNMSGTQNARHHDSAVSERSKEISGGIAVTSPVEDNFSGTSVHNSASLYIPDFVQKTIKDWHIVNSTWDSDIVHISPNLTGNDDQCIKPDRVKHTCTTEKIKNLRFMIRNPRSTPLLMKINGYEENSEEPALQISNLLIAAEAREESMAMPLRHVAMVICRYRTSTLGITHNASIGIYDNDLGQQVCSLVIARQRSSSGKDSITIQDEAGYGKLSDLLDQTVLQSFNQNALAFGVQRIEVKIVKSGEVISEDIWYYDPSGKSHEWPLIIKNPNKVKDDGSVYEIYARIIEDSKATAANETRPVQYRPGPTPQNDQVFYARLRPTGLFALPRTSKVRIFVTVPLDLTAVRFPGASVDLRSSTSNPSVQLTALRAGLLFGIEPWDYDRGKPLWPIPMRALFGFHAVDLINTYFSPSLLAGLSVTLPIIESPSQLNTSLALGAFYEFDLREKKESASRFLLTIGFNFFSLFGAKAK